MARYWLIWFAVSFGSFIIPESIALATGHPENTLSEAIWRMEDLAAGHAWPWQWTAAHFLFTGAFILLVLWLVLHFGWGLLR